MRKTIFQYITLIISISLFQYSLFTRVLHIGVDGVLQKCIYQAKHDIFDTFKVEGSYTFQARTAIQTVSAPGWSNILCGMDSEMTGITDNDWEAPWFYEYNNAITPVSGNDALPCIFKTIKDSNPNLKTGYITDWEWFNNLSSITIPGSIDYDYYCNTGGVPEYIKCDATGLTKVKDIIMNKDFDYLFYYIGQVDEQGHATGFCSDEYIQRLTVANNLIESVISYLKQANKYDDTVLIWTTDHGANFDNHGYQNDDNLLVPWLILGPGIKKGYEIQMPVKNLDTPATICKILGVTPNSLWKSRVVTDAFVQSDEGREEEIKEEKQREFLSYLE